MVPELHAVEPAGQFFTKILQVQAVQPPLPGEAQAADILLGPGGELCFDGLQNVLRAGDVDVKYLIAPLGQGYELRPAVFGFRLYVKHALLPQLVKAPSLRTAGVGPERAALPVESAVLVDVAQGQIGQAAVLDVLGGDGAVLI